jgi:DNA-binding MarR family transcriptional regulator
MAKLTDTQLVILSAAASRKDHAVLPLPKSLKIKGVAVIKMLEGLRKKGLLEEQPASREVVAWREDKDGRRMMLVITETGLRAIDGAPAGETDKQLTPTKTRVKKPRAKNKTIATKPKAETSAPTARQGTKQALLISLLKRKTGATIEEIVAATGWQAHSVRGAISGTLKKKLGLAVESKAVEARGRVYRIVAGG